MAKAKNAPADEKGPAEKNCFEAILALWKHRAEMPNGKRPFEETESVVRAIQSLDPEEPTPRYFRSVLQLAREGKEKSEAETWLDMTMHLDYSAKLLIGFCLSEAAKVTLDKSQEWVKLAEAAGAEDGVSEIVVRFVSTDADIGREPNPSDEARRRLQDRIRRLESFSSTAEGVLRDLKTRLEVLQRSTEG
jgi:hypothetical protein